MNGIIETLADMTPFGRSHSELPRPIKAVVGSWEEAMSPRRSPRWGNCRAEALNDIWESLPRNENTNPVVDSLTALVDEKLAPWDMSTVPKEFRQRVLDTMRHDFVRAALEEHYSATHKTPDFYRRLFGIYADGAFPCDWEGFLHSGTPWVYVPFDTTQHTITTKESTSDRRYGSHVFYAEQQFRHQLMSWEDAFADHQGWQWQLDESAKVIEDGLARIPHNAIELDDIANTLRSAIYAQLLLRSDMTPYQKVFVADVAAIIAKYSVVEDQIQSREHPEFFRTVRAVYETGHIPVGWSSDDGLPIVV